MTTEMQSTFISIIELLKQSIVKVSEVSSEQIPDIIAQILQYKLYESVFISLSLLIFSIVIYHLIKVVISKCCDYGGWEIILGLLWFANLASIFVCLFHIMQAVKILVAPKIFLLEYVSSFLTK